MTLKCMVYVLWCSLGTANSGEKLYVQADSYLNLRKLNPRKVNLGKYPRVSFREIRLSRGTIMN